MGNKVMLNDEMLENVSGGAIGFNPESNGTYTMVCQFTGKTFKGVSLGNAMEVAKYGATIPNTEEGEKQIINWAKGKGYI